MTGLRSSGRWRACRLAAVHCLRHFYGRHLIDHPPFFRGDGGRSAFVQAQVGHFMGIDHRGPTTTVGADAGNRSSRSGAVTKLRRPDKLAGRRRRAMTGKTGFPVWILRRLMAEHGMFATTGTLGPAGWRLRGVCLSRGGASRFLPARSTRTPEPVRHGQTLARCCGHSWAASPGDLSSPWTPAAGVACLVVTGLPARGPGPAAGGPGILPGPGKGKRVTVGGAGPAGRARARVCDSPRAALFRARGDELAQTGPCRGRPGRAWPAHRSNAFLARKTGAGIPAPAPRPDRGRRARAPRVNDQGRRPRPPGCTRARPDSPVPPMYAPNAGKVGVAR